MYGRNHPPGLRSVCTHAAAMATDGGWVASSLRLMLASRSQVGEARRQVWQVLAPGGRSWRQIWQVRSQDLAGPEPGSDPWQVQVLPLGQVRNPGIVDFT